MKMKADMFGMFIETLYIEIVKAHLECNYWNSDRGGLCYCRPMSHFQKISYFQKLPQAHIPSNVHTSSFQNMTLARLLIN